MGVISGFSKERKDEIFRRVTEFWDDATEKMAPQFALVDERERLSRGKLPQALEDAYAAYPDRSALVPPDIYNNLNSLRANIRQALFSKKPSIRLSHPRDPMVRDDSIRKAEIVLQHMNDKAAEGSGQAMNGDLVVHQALYAGITCVFTKWTVQVERRPLRNGDGSLALDDKGAPIFKPKIVSQYAEDIPIDIRRVRWNQDAAEVKDIRMVGYSSIVQKADLIAKNRTGRNSYQFDEKELIESSFPKSKFNEFGPFNLDFDNATVTNKIAELQHIRGLFAFENKDGSFTYEDLIVEVANRKMIVSLKRNDSPINSWEHFDFPAIHRESGRIWSMGVVEPAVDVFVEHFIKRNQSIDGTNRSVYVKYLVDSSADEDVPEYIEHSDDQVIRVNAAGAGLQSVQAAFDILPRPNTSVDPFNQSSALSRDVQQTMMLSDYLQGKNPSGDETATGVAALVSGGQGLTMHLIEGLADTWLRPTSKKKLILWNFQLGDKQHDVTMPSGEVAQITPGELDLPYNVSIETSLAATQPSAQRRFIEVYPIISNDPFYDQLEVRQTLNEMLDLPNRDRLLVNPNHLETTVTNESIALGYGVDQQVDPADNHQKHIENHSKYLAWVEEQLNRPNLTSQEATQIGELRTDLLEEHIQEHMDALAQQQEALGNTKALGGNSGNLVQPDGASHKVGSGGSTGNYTPRENR